MGIQASKTNSPLKRQYDKSIADFCDKFAKVVLEKHPNLDDPAIKAMFYSPPAGSPPPPEPDCLHKKWKEAGGKANPARSGPGAMNPDHMHPASLNGPLTSSNLIWADARVNRTVGGSMDIDPAPNKVKAHSSCNCP